MVDGPTQRIGIFGGSFDPIHLGHLIIATDAIEQLELDRVVFVPAAQAPLKSNCPQASAADRLQMIQAAIAETPQFECSAIEIERGGTSYSIDTANALAETFPDARLFWILGDDQAKQLDKWRDIDSLAKKVDFIIFARTGPSGRSDRPDRPPATLRSLEKRRIDISSTEIRQRIQESKSFKYFLPEGVFRYIKARNLYHDSANSK